VGRMFFAVAARSQNAVIPKPAPVRLTAKTLATVLSFIRTSSFRIRYTLCPVAARNRFVFCRPSSRCYSGVWLLVSHRNCSAREPVWNAPGTPSGGVLNRESLFVVRS
jgi:hypothetical protein